MGDKVYVRNFTTLLTWLSGTLLEQTGPVSFRVQLSIGRIYRRYVDHISIRHIADEITSNASSFVVPGIPTWPVGQEQQGTDQLERPRMLKTEGGDRRPILGWE